MPRRERERLDSRRMKTGKGVNARTEGSVAGKRGREPNVPVVVVAAAVVVRWKSRWWRPPVWLIFYYPTPEPPTPPPHSLHPSRDHYPCRFFLVANGGGKEETRGEQGGKAWSREGREVRGNVAEGLRWPDARWKRPQGSFRRDDAGCITGFQRTFVRYFRDRHSKRHVFFFSFFFLKREISLNSILSLFLSRVIFGELYFEVCIYIGWHFNLWMQLFVEEWFKKTFKVND